MQAVALHMIPTYRNMENGCVTFTLRDSPDCDVGMSFYFVSENEYDGNKFSDAFVYSLNKGNTWLPYKRDQKIWFKTIEDGEITDSISFRTIKDLNTLCTHYKNNDETHIYDYCYPRLHLTQHSGFSGSDVDLAVDGDMEYLIHTSKYTISKDGTKKRKPFDIGMYYEFFHKDQYLRESLVDVSNLTLFSVTNNQDQNDSILYDLPDFAFYQMFMQCNRITTDSRDLDAVNSVGRYCCYGMYLYCSSLEHSSQSFSPETVSEFSCAYMYAYCSSLIMATTSLPAVKAEPHCYRNMFQGCSSLLQAPDLGLIYIEGAEYCCYWMFVDCTSLRGTVELLPTQSFPYLGFVSMFSNCTSLNAITVHFTTWSSSMVGWVANVADTGTFTCPKELGTQKAEDGMPILRGDSYCPAGWTVENP